MGLVPDSPWSADTVAVVTGSNTGIGFELVRQLARRGLTVVLTARSEARGQAAMEALRGEGLHQSVHLHQLDVTDAASIQALAAWLRDQFGGIDILVNNAGVLKMSNTYAHAVETMDTNYFGAKNVTKALLPLFRNSTQGARIVMNSSRRGQLKRFTKSDWMKNQLGDLEKLNEEYIDALANQYVSDVKDGTWDYKEWAPNVYQYSESKACLNAYARVLARDLATAEPVPVLVAALCPGAVESGMTIGNLPIFLAMGLTTVTRKKIQLKPVAVGAGFLVRLILHPRQGFPSGLMFWEDDLTPHSW